MKLGVFTVLFAQRTLEETLEYVASKGLDAVEIGTGGYPGNAHCNLEELLQDKGKQNDFRKAVDSRGLTISAFSCHGNPLHPQKAISAEDDRVIRQTIDLASQMGVPVVNTFSGCPGDHEDAKYPNWPVAPWPNDYQEILNGNGNKK